MMEAATLIGSPPAVAAEETTEEFSRELHSLWFALAARSWSALAVVPASGATGAARVAKALSRIGRRTTVDRPVALLDASGAGVDQVPGLADALASHLARGERVVVALDRLEDNPASFALASRCDAALLCLMLGESDVRSTRETIEKCGRTRFIGSVALVPGSR
jgi:hypothetical protein